MTTPIDPWEFRRALGQFGTGVTVITTCEPDGTPRGFTANSFSSVSLNPPLVSVCVASTAASAAVFKTTPWFSINILAEEQRDVSNVFATQRPDKFLVTEWKLGKTGMPLISGTLVTFECSQHTIVEAGDHLILIGRVEAFETREGWPLLYYRGAYQTLERVPSETTS